MVASSGRNGGVVILLFRSSVVGKVGVRAEDQLYRWAIVLFAVREGKARTLSWLDHEDYQSKIADRRFARHWIGRSNCR